MFGRFQTHVLAVISAIKSVILIAKRLVLLLTLVPEIEQIQIQIIIVYLSRPRLSVELADVRVVVSDDGVHVARVRRVVVVVRRRLVVVAQLMVVIARVGFVVTADVTVLVLLVLLVLVMVMVKATVTAAIGHGGGL